MGCTWDGVFRLDGTSVRHFTRADGMATKHVFAVSEDRQGDLWFASGGQDGGISRYDGEGFQRFTVKDGLVDDRTIGLGLGPQGDLLIATSAGVSRHDGERFHTFFQDDSLGMGNVISVFADRDGHSWFGGIGQVLRHDGERSALVPLAGASLSSEVFSITQDQRGQMYFGTYGGGVFRYDGLVFQPLSTAHGLPSNAVQEVLDHDGAIWIATEAGVSRFKPGSEVPSIRLVNVIADRQYGVVETLTVPVTQDFVTFEFRGRSLSTPADGMVYVYRLQGYEQAWQTTREEQVVYRDLPRGDFIFEVKAVERDLNYSVNTAQVTLHVGLPYAQIGGVGGLGLSLLVIVLLWVRLVRSKDAAESANKAKSQFLANISHEIRTPMNAILGYAQLLQYSDHLTKKDQRDLEAIRHSGDHLLSLINEVLDISKIEVGRLELDSTDFDLNALLKNMAVLFERRCLNKQLAWHLEGVDTAVLPVRGDQAKLRQVLLNLLANGVKFTQEGEVCLSISSPAPDRYCFTVSDTGVGISAAEQQQLFTPFYQGTAGHDLGGTGLGLSISSRLVKLMGGELTVESTLGMGSQFSFTIMLPQAEGDVNTDEATSWYRVARLAPGFQIKALVADDVEENRDILYRMLNRLGVEVELAEHGQQVLDRMEVTVPDIVLLDIRMPVMDGLEALAHIKQQEAWRQVKVVAISSSVLDHQRQEFLDTGFDDFLGKPFRLERLCQCLSSQLKIEYEYVQEKDTAASAEQTADGSAMILPAALHARLLEAAELNQVTLLEAGLDELNQLGGEPSRLAGQLERMLQSFDMEAIRHLIGTIRHD